MISVTAASKFLTGDPDHATLVVPDRAIGAMVTVNAVLTRTARLVRVMEDAEKAAAKARRDAGGRRVPAAAQGSMSPEELSPDEHAGGGGHGGGGHSHLRAEWTLAKNALKRIGKAPILRRMATSIGGTAKTLLKGGSRVGGRLLPGLGMVMGGMDLYQQATTGDGTVSTVDAALTGASTGALIGSFFPVVGTAIGAAVGAGVGAVGALAYNHTDAIVRSWRQASTWISKRTDDVKHMATSAWDHASAGFQKMGSLVGDTLHKAWTSVTDSYTTYQGNVGKWITEQSHNVGTWLDSVVHQMESTINNFNLRGVAVDFLEKLKSWLGEKLGLGGGSGGGGLDATGRVPGVDAPSARGRGPTPAGDRAPPEAPPPLPAHGRAPDPKMYSPGGTINPANVPLTKNTLTPHEGSPGTYNLSRGYAPGQGTTMGFAPGGFAYPRMHTRAEEPTLSKNVEGPALMYQRGGLIPGMDLKLPTTGTPDVHEGQMRPGTIRHLPIKDSLREQLQFAAEKTGLQVEIGSGGQPALGSGEPRTGSTRHDLGGAADLSLFEVGPDGKRRQLSMKNPADAARMEEYTRQAVRAGATGVGAGEGYMGPNMIHIGGGTTAHWGGAPWIEKALRTGRQTRGEGQAEFDKWKLDRSAAKEQADSITENKDQKPTNIFAGRSPGAGFLPKKADLDEHELTDDPGVKFDKTAARHAAADAAIDKEDWANTKKWGIVDMKGGGQSQYDLSDPHQAKMYTDSKMGSGSRATSQHGDMRVSGRHEEDQDIYRDRIQDKDLAQSWNPGHAPEDAGPKPSTIDEAQGKDKTPVAEKAEEPPAKAKTDAPPSHHASSSLDDIPTVHPNVHLAVSGHTDKYA